MLIGQRPWCPPRRSVAAAPGLLAIWRDTAPLYDRTEQAMSPEEMYRLHKHRVYRLCLRFCGGQVALAEDLTQDVFVKMLERMDELSARDGLEPWLYRVTTNACFSRLKRENSVWHRVREALSRQPTQQPPTPERQLQLREDMQEIMDTLQALPAQERIVFCMHVMDGLPQRDICDVLDLSKGYVSKLLRRARERLEKSLQAQECQEQGDRHE